MQKRGYKTNFRMEYRLTGKNINQSRGIDEFDIFFLQLSV